MTIKVKSTETFEEDCDEAYEIAEKEMIKYYGVSKIEDLTPEQLNEIYLYSGEEALYSKYRCTESNNR